jgi:4-amino-4-deoxy-L-arabinose transferase-like glycosyltransferase
MTLAISYLRKRGIWASLLAVVAVLCVANTWWLDSYRSGLPFNIDEAGYLAESIRFGHAIRAGSGSQFGAVWEAPNSIGPLLPLVAGFVHALTGAGPWALLAVEQIFYALTVVGSFLLGRIFMRPSRALLSAVVVASLPGLFDAGRIFYLAEPAAALMVLLLAIQFVAVPFDSLKLSLLWGLILGLTTMTRTMILALLLAPVLVAIVQLVVAGLNRRRIVNIGLALLLGAVTSGLWYFYTLSAVLSYLTNYGYGSQSDAYGDHHSITSFAWWTHRLSDIVNQEIYFPVLCVLVIVSVIAIIKFAANIRRPPPSSTTASNYISPAWYASPKISLLAIVIIDYLVLSSSRNTGSYFELPLAPLVVILFFSALPGVLGRPVTALVAAASVIAATLNVADQFNLVPGSTHHTSVALAGTQVTLFNASTGALAGPKVRKASLGGTFWNDCGGATVTCFYGLSNDISGSYIDSWKSASATVVDLSYSLTHQHGREPVLFFAYQGPLLNTNTVSLAAAENALNLPIGALVPTARLKNVSLVTQLEAPAYGQPNLVIAGVPPSLGSSLAGPGSSASDLRAVDELLEQQGFTEVYIMDLPSAQPLAFWWKDR